MSVAPRTMSVRSRMQSQRSSTGEEVELVVGAVVVMLSDKKEDQSAAAYRSPPGNGGQDDAKPISTTSTQKDQCFMAVLAPSCDAAMSSLQSQPPGTYLLAKEEDETITVYVKFRQAVRVLPLVKGKEIKKNGDCIQLAKLQKKELGVLMQTPVHKLRLAPESYFLVEQCWKRFLPQVQAVVFELCCEPHLDEEIKLEDWTPSMIPPSEYSLGLMQEACGFYILAGSGNGADSTSSAIQVRQVEFDFNKFAITVADGTLKPSALLLATSFGSKRAFEPDFAFNVIRDNFLTPDLVMLKETTVNTIPPQQFSLQNCIDLSSNDRELAVLSAADVACGEIMSDASLPGSFLAVLHEMHVYFVNTVIRDESTPSSKSAPWSAQKMKLVGRIIPILLELLIASADYSETSRSVVPAVDAESKKKQIFAQFSRAMRFDILFMAARSDDSVICRLTHQLCQLLGARIRLPAELVDIIRDLVALFPVFLRLFLRNQGIAMLWSSVHHKNMEKDADSASDPHGKSNFRSFRALTSSTIIINALQGKGERKLLSFGLGRKPQTKSRKSLSLGMNLTSTSFLRSKAFAFSRLSPLAVQMYLGLQLREGYFTSPDVWTEDPVLAKITFCSCTGRPIPKRLGAVVSTKPGSVCARTRLRSSPKVITYELLLQLSLCFLYHKSSFVNWDRDVALLLRLEEVHRHLFDEIICIVRRQTDAQDINTQESLFCELRVVIACVSTLFRLERKRRHEVNTAVGDKRYLQFIHLFKTKIRELNERLKVEASYDDQTRESEGEDGVQTGDTDAHFLSALANVFKWIPRAFLDEWIVLSLKELLQTVNALRRVVKQTTIPLIKQLQYVRHAYQFFRVFAVMLKRTSDPEIQTVLVRVLGLDCPAIISLLRFVLSTHSLSLNGGRDSVCIQVHVLNFLSAFVNLDVALTVQFDWDSNNNKPNEEGGLNEDAEVIEQLKGELLIRLLGPRMTIEDAEQNDQTVWDFMLELMFPNSGTNTVASFDAASCMLGMAVSFRSASVPPILLTNISRGHFQLKEAFLLLQQALYTAQDVSSPIDYEHCVASHLRRIEQYSDRIIENEAQEELYMVYRMVELNFRCLIVLASRRSQFPAIEYAFNRAHVLSAILQRLQPHQNAVSARPQRENSGSVASDEATATIPCLPPLKLPRRSSTDNSEVLSIAKLSLSPPVSGVNIAQNFILAEPGLHALAIVLVVTYIIVDPNLEIDETVCPRISVPCQIEADSNKPSELLWTLQQHLATVDMDQRYFEALMVEMETLQAFVSTARLSAIRSLLRLLCPNRFDCNIYTTTGGSKQAREYIAKGAFSTVYRQHPALPRPQSVAVKVVEHQRRPGKLCAVSGLFNEVSILSELRGDLAATQLVDFGNNQAEQSFEIVMEYCPCSLTEWRATIKGADSEVPFRSCLIMILRAFEEACQCLTRIHHAGVCHFDIKSDNILVRSSACELSHRLLEDTAQHEDDAPSKEFKGWLCFADFGESKVVATDRMPVRTFTFSSFSSGAASPVSVQKRAERFMSLTRTRGTEAIKSPEVLEIKGSEVAEVKVTLASDIWSLGCLLYELVTQELLFQNDDWAGLYAHLVVIQDQSVLRSDHKQKMFEALKPTSSDEETVLTNLTELCSTILAREPNRRPKLETIAAQVRKLINDVYELPVTASDETFIKNLYQLNGATSTPEAPRLVSALGPFPNATPSRPLRPDAHGVIVPVRLFWNFFLAADITRTQDVQTVTSCIGSGSEPASKDVLVMDAFEDKYEAHFEHFVYLSWHDSATPPDDPSAHGHSSRRLIEELHEEEHRTCFLLNRQSLNSSVETPELHLFQQLVQYASQYFPVLQRRLRDEAGCVVFVALGKDAEDTKELQQVLTAMLLFFLRSALAMAPYDLLSYFARDCAQFFDYPRPEFLQHLVAYSVAHVQDSATCVMVQCHCGASVLTVETAALSNARSSQHCTCSRSSSSSDCVCFHPFLVNDDNGVDFDEEEFYTVDKMFVHDGNEEQLVLPMETRARRGDEVRWVAVDAVAVGRAEGSTTSWTRPERRLPVDGLNRSISSRFKLSRASKVAGEETSEEMQLVRGLQRCGKAITDWSSSDKWELYECELCRLPICALAEGKVAVPMLHPHR